MKGWGWAKGPFRVPFHFELIWRSGRPFDRPIVASRALKTKRWTSRLILAGAVLVVGVLLGGCGGEVAEEGDAQPAVVEHGTEVDRVVLTREAAKRLDIHTAEVRKGDRNARRTVIPYSAVLYDPDGATWTYTNPAPLVFARQDITVDRIEGKSAFLSAGPPVGTSVVTVGADELWGVEYGGIEED
jgi:hypothetical protein